VAGLVRESLDRRVPLSELVAAHSRLGPEAATLLEAGAAVGRRTTAGGAGPAAVGEQLRRFARRVARDEARLSG
jgi:argininosuccinate lyase